MITPITFLNSPIYSIGDIFVNNRENELWGSGSGSEYFAYEYSQWDTHSAYEYYQYGDYSPSSTTRSESFHYYADTSTEIIYDISSHVTIRSLDSESRDVSEENYSIMHFEWGEGESSSYINYTYEDSTSYKLISSSKQEATEYTSYGENGDDYNYLQSEFMTYTYDYTGLSDHEIQTPHDYSTRWGSGNTTFSDNEGFTVTFNLYSKESRSQSRRGGGTWEEMRVETDEHSGIITRTHISSDQYGSNRSSYLNVYTDDWNADGIIDSRNDYSESYRNGIGSTISTQKEDWDSDGFADYLFMTRERSSQQGISRTEYTYRTDSRRPILEIRQTIDTNADGIPESEVERVSFTTLTPRLTSMGEHAVTLEDVLA